MQMNYIITFTSKSSAVNVFMYSKKETQGTSDDNLNTALVPGII